LNQWNHFVGVCNGSTIELFWNGEKRASYNSVGSINNNHTGAISTGYFPGNLFSDGNNFDGKSSNYMFYNRALSPDEIQTLYVDSLAPFRKKQQVAFNAYPLTLLQKIRSAAKPTTPVSVRVKHNEKPSYKAGYAKSADESASPHLWDGLVGAWMPSMGDCGYNLNDLSGRGNHAELDGRISPAPLKVIDGSMQIVLDGSSDYFRINSVKDFSPKELTYCYWVTQPLLAGTYAPGGVWRTGRRSWLSQHGSGYPQFYHSNNGSTSSVLTSSVQLINNKLTFVAMRYGKGSKSIWQNGVRTALATGAGVSGDLFDSQTEFCIGDFLFYDSSTIFGRNWQGGISAQMVYNRVLSPQEIQELYVDSLAPFRRKAKPIGYQPNKELRGLFRT